MGEATQIVLAVVAVVGLVVGGMRYLQNNAKRDALLDAAIDEKTGWKARLDAQDKILGALTAALDELRRVTKPNGMKNDEIGNVTKRTEEITREIARQLNIILPEFGEKE